MTSTFVVDPGNGNIPLEDAAAEPLAQPVATGGSGQAPSADDPTEQVIAELSRAVAGAMLAAFRQLYNAGTREIRAIVQRQEEALAAAAGRVAEVAGEVRNLADTVEWQKTAGEATHLAVNELRSQLAELAGSTNDRIEALVRRIGLQAEEIGAWQAAHSSLPLRVEAVAERLDRQAEAIRTLWDSKSHTQQVLEELVGILARLRASAAAPALPSPADL